MVRFLACAAQGELSISCFFIARITIVGVIFGAIVEAIVGAVIGDIFGIVARILL